MHGNSDDVSAYLANVPAGQREYLAVLRDLCRHILTDHEECIEHGMPGYKKENQVKVAFASHKRYISLYILEKGIIQDNLTLLKGMNVGKSCIRYTKPEKMDFEIIKKLLFDTHHAQEDCE